MAEFNPQVPATNDPNYFKYSDSISNLKPNQSKGIALESAGNIGDAAVKLGDQYIKGNIDEKVNAFADKERSDFTSALEQIKNGAPQPVQTATGGKVLSFADEGESNLPPAITQGMSKIDSLTQAYQNGKVNDTYYTMRLDADVKALRAQYPGYRDYIDERVSKNTGMNPANEYVKNLMQDINRAQTNKKTEYDKDLDLARGALKYLPGAAEQFNKLQADPSYQGTFREWYYNANQNYNAIERDNAVRANRKMTKEESAADDEQKFTDVVGRTLDTNFHSMTTIPGTQTPQGILDFVKDANAHPEAYQSSQYQAWATVLQSQKAVLQSQLIAESNKTRDGAPSYTSSIGVSKRDAIIKGQLDVYDQVISAITNKDAGLAFLTMNQARAYLDDTKNKILKSSMGEAVAMTKTFNDAMGPSWTTMVTDKLLRANIDTGMRELFNESALRARAQPDPNKPVTFKEQMDEADKHVASGKMTSAMKSRYAGNLINIVDDLKDPKAPDAAKVNVAKYLFSPEGQGLLSHISTDYTDPKTGKFVPGKYSVFSRLTSDDVVQSIAKLSKSDPAVGKMYKNYLENEAGSQLFYKELQNLNHFTGHDDLHFSYDSDNHQITLLDKAGKSIPKPTPVVGNQFGIPYVNSTPQARPDASYIFQAQKIVNRINDGLSGLGRVEKGLGGDVNTYLLDFLQHSQVDLGKNWTGLPEKLVNAIAASRAPARKIEDTFKDLKQ